MSDAKWQVGFWVIAVLVIGSFSWTTMCAYSADLKIGQLNDKFIAALHNIDLRLSRIEYKLGVGLERRDESGVRV